MFWRRRRRKRRRRYKISKFKLCYHLLIVIHISLILLQGYGRMAEWYSGLWCVKRTSIVLMVKGWASNWELHHVVDTVLGWFGM